VLNRSLDRAAKQSLSRGKSFVDAATALLGEGTDGFTVQEVATAAGQSLRTLYHHFESKDDLLLAVFEEQMALHTEHTREAIQKFANPCDQLAALVISAVEQRGGGGNAIVLSQFRMRLATNHPADIAVVQGPFVQLVRETVQAAIDTRAIPDVDPLKVAYLITTLKSSYMVSRNLGNDLGMDLPSPEDLAQFCLAGVGAKLPARFMTAS
jgi:AcrR family transcriptional regulator